MIWDIPTEVKQNSNPEVSDTGKSLTDMIRIIGYIAGRKNTLTPSIRKEDAKAAFEDLKKQKLASNPNGVNIPKKSAKGEEVAGENVRIAPETKYGKIALRSMDFNEFTKLSEGVYDVALKEASAEFLTVVIPSRLNVENSEGISNSKIKSTIKSSSAANANNSVLLIKPKAFAEAMLSSKTSQVNVGVMENGNFDRKGLVYATAKISNTKTGKKKLNVKTNYLEIKSMSKVDDIGYLGLPYAVNRSFVGERPNVKDITNKDKVLAAMPGINFEALGLTKKLVHVEGKGMMVEEQIEFEVYKDAYEKMMVTPQMLEDIRKKKSSGKGKMDIVVLDDIAEESFKAYEQYKSLSVK